jgi:hypothetical protein
VAVDVEIVVVISHFQPSVLQLQSRCLHFSAIVRNVTWLCGDQRFIVPLFDYNKIGLMLSCTFLLWVKTTVRNSCLYTWRTVKAETKQMKNRAFSQLISDFSQCAVSHPQLLTREGDTTAVIRVFHVMSTLKGKLEETGQRQICWRNNRDMSYTRKTEYSQDPVNGQWPAVFYTNAIAYMVKWFNFSGENYVKRVEYLSLYHVK